MSQSQELAVRELPTQLTHVVTAGLAEPLVRAALNQSSWAKAFQSGGITAIAGALMRCHNLGLDPLADHVYVIEVQGKWTHMLSAFGRLKLAAAHPEYGGVVTVEEGEDDTHVWVKRVAYRVRGGFRFPAGEGEGRKPKSVKIRDKQVPDPHARRKAATQALRWALTEAFGDILPAVTSDEAKYSDDVIDMSPDAALPAAKEPPAHTATPPATTTDRAGGSTPNQASRDQIRMLMAVAGSLEYDRDQRLSEASRILGRTVDTFNSLTRSEAHALADEWNTRLNDLRAAAEQDTSNEPDAAEPNPFAGDPFDTKEELW